MPRAQTMIFLLLTATLSVAAYLTLRSFEVLGPLRLADVRPVREGQQEIAWISTAAGGDTWERLVAAVRLLEKQGLGPQSAGAPRLRAFLDRVFRERTTDVPELALWLEGHEHAKLWIRWYKVSSEIDAPAWLDKLSQRERPPVAILGGENSDRALSLAKLLATYGGKWRGDDPLFLITTATAERDARDENLNLLPWTDPRTPKLMHVYKNRTFRFSFTNSRMAEVAISFVKDHPEVWSQSRHAQTSLALVLGAENPLTSLALVAGQDLLSPVSLYTLAWADDPYSKDLADRFGDLFRLYFEEPTPPRAGGDVTEGPGGDLPKIRPRIMYDRVPYGVGDYESPNPAEAYAIERFFDKNQISQGQRQLLVLPTGTQRVRRFLRTLARRAPTDVSNLVVLSGDSITFNNVYRDRDVAWNILDVPVPLVFFSHRNPISSAAGFQPQPSKDEPSAPTSTHDLLLHRDVVEAVVQAACQEPGVLPGAAELNKRLRRLCWDKGRFCSSEGRPFFDEDGNRRDGTGEHVVWVQPIREGTHVLPQATIRVWRLRPGTPAGQREWHQVNGQLDVLYDWPPRPAQGEF